MQDDAMMIDTIRCSPDDTMQPRRYDMMTMDDMTILVNDSSQVDERIMDNGRWRFSSDAR